MKSIPLPLLYLAVASLTVSAHADQWSFAGNVDASQGAIQESDDGPFLDLSAGEGFQLPDGLVAIPGKHGNLIIKGEFKIPKYSKPKTFFTLVGWGAQRNNARVQIHVVGKRLRALVAGPAKGIKPVTVLSEPDVKLNTWHQFEFRVIRGIKMELILDGQSFYSKTPIGKVNLSPTAPLCLGIGYQPGAEPKNGFKGLLRNFSIATGTGITEIEE